MKLVTPSFLKTAFRASREGFPTTLHGKGCVMPSVMVCSFSLILMVNASSIYGQDQQPIAVQATDGLHEDRVEITWSEIANNAAARITVERDGQSIAVLAGTETQFSDASGDPGVEYEYCVSVSRPGEALEAGVCDNGARIIFSPTNFVASDGLYEDGVLLTWADRSEHEAQYQISRRLFQQEFSVLTTLSANAISYKDTSAIVGLEYEYCVKAVDPKGFFSTNVCDNGLRAAVTPPANVAASDGQYINFVRIGWIDQSLEEEGFGIYRDGIPIASVPANITYFEDSGADLAVPYVYCVTSMVNGNESVKVCDSGMRGGLTPPENVVASDASFDDRVSITWSAVADSEDGFEVLRIPADHSDSVLVGIVPANSTIFNDFEAVQGASYTYCVRAFSKADTNAISYSDMICDSGTRSNVLAPENVAATDSLFEDRVEISWSSRSTTAMLFNVYRNDVLIKTLPTSRTSYSDLEIGSGIEYQYSVSSETVVASSAEQHQQLRNQIEAMLLEALREENGVDQLSKVQTSDQKKHRQAGKLLETIEEEILRFQAKASLTVNQSASLSESERVSDGGSRKIKSPASVSATYDEHEDHVEITWDDVSEVTEGFYIYRGGVRIDSVSAARTSYGDYQGEPGREHNYSVSTFDEFGESDLVSDLGFRELEAPTSVEASDGKTETLIEVAWEDASRSESGYEIARNGEVIDTTFANITTYVDSNDINFGMAYEYSITAVDPYGRSATVSDSGFTTVHSPSNVNASNTYENQITVVWVDASGIEDGYQITRRRITQEVLDKDLILLPNSTSFIDSIAMEDIGLKFLYCLTAFSVDSDSVHFFSDEVCSAGQTLVSSVTKSPEPARKTVSTDVGGGEFGHAVAINGEYALVGIPGSGQGKAQIYMREMDGLWTPKAILLQQGTSRFGSAIDISEDYAIVGAPNAGQNGEVYFYKRDGTTWSQLGGVFFGHNQNFNDKSDEVGAAVSLDGNRGLIGAPRNDTSPDNQNFGGAYVFQFSVNGWEEQAALNEVNDVDLQPSDQFGSAVAINGNFAIVGAPFAESSKGEAYIFEYNGVSWELTAKDILPFLKRQNGARFGSAVAIDSEDALVAAPFQDNRGIVYVFKRDPVLGWLLQEERLLPLELDRQDGAEFGASVSLSGNYAIVGAPGESEGGGAVYFFEFDVETDSWSPPVRLTAAIAGMADPGDSFGNSVTMGAGYYIVGTPGDDDGGLDAGAFYSVPFEYVPPDPTSTPLAPPSDVSASDDRDLSIQIKWQDNATREEGYRIYRSDSEGRLELIASVPENTKVFNDVEAVPGTAYEYRVAAFLGKFSESERIGDFGWRPPNGSLSGRVAALAGGGTAGVEVCLDPSPNRGLLFDGSAGTVKVAGLTTLPDAYTIEFWAHRASPGGVDPILSIGQPDDNMNVRLGFSGDVFRFGFGAEELDFDHGPGGDWNHWAVTFAPGQPRRIYRDGVQVQEGEPIAITQVDGPLFLGSYFSFDDQHFSGRIDEVRIWDYVRSALEISKDRFFALTGNEPGLVGYWPMNQGEQRVVADLSHAANHGVLIEGVYWADQGAPLDICATTDAEGNFTLSNLRYGDATTFTVTPSLGVRSFDPAFKTITLNGDNPVQNEVDFIDNTAFTITGLVRFAEIECPVPEVEIYVDGVIKGKTESDGTFAISVDPSENDKDLRLIEPRLVNARDASDIHVFIPADTLVFVEKDIIGMNFVDIKTRTLSGFFGGSCSIDIGTATLRIFTENGCFEREIEVGGDYTLELPPQQYLIHVSDVQPTNDARRGDIITFFDDFGAQPVDLTAGDDTLDFIYHAPLQVAIEGLEPDQQCQNLITGDGRELESVAILEQGEVLPLRLTVFEDFGDGNSCPVEEGIITIFDEISDLGDAPTELSISGGSVEYDIIAGTPNIFAGRSVDGVDRSFQKSFTVLAKVDGRDPVTLTQWALVTGVRPRAATFVTATSDEHPLFVIQDPPGDGSSAFLEKGTKLCMDWVFHESFLAGVDVDIKTKVGFKVLTGIGAAVESQAFAGLNITVGGAVGGVFEQKMHYCVSTTERFGTSSDDNFVGPDADVFVGAAMNFKFAEADLLEVDGCNLVLTETLAGGLDDEEPFATTFAYTTQYIRDILIPQLQALIEKDPNSLAAMKFELSIRKWNDFLAEAADARVTTRALEPTTENNRSFSAGTTFEFKKARDSTWSRVRGLQETLHFDIGKGFKTESTGTGVIVFLTFKSSAKFSQISTNDSTSSSSVGYVLVDDDLGDFFTVNVGNFERYGTKSFALMSGTSSNPWELGTQPRDRAQLAINPPLQNGVPSDEPTTFTLSLTNAGESQETREYILRTVHTSNPGGAVLSANGSPLHAGLSFYLGPQQTQEVTLKVDRGPTRYAYEDLGVQLYPPGEYSIWQDGGLNGNGIIQQADTARFSVFFNAPCSNISILRPFTNWCLNSLTIHDSLDIILHEFILVPSESDKVSQLGLEYRPKNSSIWLPAVSIQQADLAVDATSWSTKWLPPQDGVFELRAFTECDAGGRVNSQSIIGSVDTKPPQVLGTPRPSDQVLALGGDIALTFDEEIDCSSIITKGDGANVILTYVDGPNAGERIPDLEAVCDGRTITLSPPHDFAWNTVENLRLQAQLLSSVKDIEGNAAVVKDKAGNPIPNEISWQFTVRQNALTWRPTNVEIDAYAGQGATVKATLVNGRAQQIGFSLTDIPDWLNPSISAGTLPPGGEIQITFAAADTLPLGVFDKAIKAHTDDGDALLFIRVHVREDDRPQQIIPLAAGWSWFSINRNPSNVAINHILGDLTSTNGDLVKNQTAFSIYDRTLGGWVGSLDAIEPGQTYLAKLASANTLVVDGPPVDVANTPLALASGWNWIGFLPQSPLPLNDALASLSATADDLVKSQTAFAIYDATSGQWLGSLEEMNPGEGYLLNVADSGTLTYPQGDNMVSALAFLDQTVRSSWDMTDSETPSLMSGVAHPDKTFMDNKLDGQASQYNAADILDKFAKTGSGWIFDASAFAHSMTLTARIQIAGNAIEKSTLKLGAFVGEELRGVGQMRYIEQLRRNLVFLIIYSDEKQGEEIQFRVFNGEDESILTCEQAVVFEANVMIGTPAEPFVINSQLMTEQENYAELPHEFSLKLNYPNPFNPSTAIHYELPNASHVRIRVFDILGREVETLLDDDREGGRYSLVFEAGHLASGVYFYSIEASGFRQVRKMILLK